MRLTIPFALFYIPIKCALAQSTQAASNGDSVQVSVSTAVSTIVGFNQDGQTMTVLSTSLTTLTLTSAPPAASGNSSTNSTSNSSNSTTSSNQTSVMSAAPSTSLTPAPTDVDGGGNGPGGAPSPGTSASGGIYGPNDSFVAAASVKTIHVGMLVATTALVAFMAFAF